MGFYDWTSERITKLLDMRLKGFTATQIGRAMGITRGSVMGKVNGLGVCRPGTQSENGSMGGKAVRKLKLKAARYNSRFEKTPPALKRLGTIPAELPALSTSVPVKFADLKSYHCRWPIGDLRSGLLFCGAHHERGTMYCAYHYEASVRRQGDDKV